MWLSRVRGILGLPGAPSHPLLKLSCIESIVLSQFVLYWLALSQIGHWSPKISGRKHRTEMSSKGIKIQKQHGWQVTDTLWMYGGALELATKIGGTLCECIIFTQTNTAIHHCEPNYTWHVQWLLSGWTIPCLNVLLFWEICCEKIKVESFIHT